MSSSDEPPEIKDHPGRGDEWLAYFIVALPFALIALLTVAYVAGVATGRIPAPSRAFWQSTYDDVGQTVVYAGAILIGAAYLLAVMKVYGAKPVQWLAERVHFGKLDVGGDDDA